MSSKDGHDTGVKPAKLTYNRSRLHSTWDLTWAVAILKAFTDYCVIRTLKLGRFESCDGRHEGQRVTSWWPPKCEGYRTGARIPWTRHMTIRAVISAFEAPEWRDAALRVILDH